MPRLTEGCSSSRARRGGSTAKPTRRLPNSTSAAIRQRRLFGQVADRRDRQVNGRFTGATGRVQQLPAELSSTDLGVHRRHRGRRLPVRRPAARRWNDGAYGVSRSPGRTPISSTSTSRPGRRQPGGDPARQRLSRARVTDLRTGERMPFDQATAASPSTASPAGTRTTPSSPSTPTGARRHLPRPVRKATPPRPGRLPRAALTDGDFLTTGTPTRTLPVSVTLDLGG